MCIIKNSFKVDKKRAEFTASKVLMHKKRHQVSGEIKACQNLPMKLIETQTSVTLLRDTECYDVQVLKHFTPLSTSSGGHGDDGYNDGGEQGSYEGEGHSEGGNYNNQGEQNYGQDNNGYNQNSGNNHAQQAPQQPNYQPPQQNYQQPQQPYANNGIYLENIQVQPAPQAYNNYQTAPVQGYNGNGQSANYGGYQNPYGSNQQSYGEHLSTSWSIFWLNK